MESDISVQVSHVLKVSAINIGKSGADLQVVTIRFKHQAFDNYYSLTHKELVQLIEDLRAVRYSGICECCEQRKAAPKCDGYCKVCYRQMLDATVGVNKGKCLVCKKRRAHDKYEGSCRTCWHKANQ